MALQELAELHGTALQEHTQPFSQQLFCVQDTTYLTKPQICVSGCCLPSLFQIIRLVLFWWVFFDQARQSEIFPVFCQIVKKSSVQNLEVLLLIFSHTDSKEIISSLICAL